MTKSARIVAGRAAIQLARMRCLIARACIESDDSTNARTRTRGADAFGRASLTHVGSSRWRSHLGQGRTAFDERRYALVHEGELADVVACATPAELAVRERRACHRDAFHRERRAEKLLRDPRPLTEAVLGRMAPYIGIDLKARGATDEHVVADRRGATDAPIVTRWHRRL
eukprot:scaffold7236_cov69-Phaeocystis_antarctica.AAC.9